MRRYITIMLMILLSTIVAQGQIKIGGNVYGGGNHANVDGSTNVRVRAGDINKVFGGARMANIGGNTYVNIDGKNALAYMIINYVYGGNDVAGTIGTAAAVGETLPTELTGNTDGVDNTWNSYVHLSTKTPSEAVYYTQTECDEYNTEHSLSEGDPGFRTTSDIKTPAVTEEKCFIGQLFAGGNGDFNYKDDEGNPLMDGEKYIVTEDKIINGTPTTITVATSTTPLNIPELDKTYLDIQGGTIFFAHGGGNNATVREKTVIHVDNPSEVVNSITNPDSVVAVTNPTGELLTDSRIYNLMGVRMVQESVASDEFQIGRLFGGNNKAEMAIRPTWNLQSGAVRNLYSGGNRGNMTSPEGLLLEIKETSTIKVDNVYGGCRMADVIPTVNGEYSPCTNLQDKDNEGNLIYKFPNELSARTLIRGGDINNVYGGNDVTGTVYGGNAIGIYTTIRGDVYGGGNGAYAYTDMDTYENDETYGDFYYSTAGYSTTIDALNAFRPNAEQVAIRLKGKDAEHPTIIKGSVFCGGNCASLATKKANPMVELKIGSHVIADKVFMGNNGEKMIDEDVLKHYAGVYPGAESYSTLSTMKTDPSVFASYMQGVTMNLQPAIVFDNTANGDPDTYEDYTSKIGSLYCGGNVGSMAIAGKNTYSVDRGLIIFEKVVAGCNNADVEAGKYNPAYSGGILGAENERGNASNEYYTDNGTAAGKIKDRIELNLDNLTVEPRRWNDTFAEITAEDLVDGKLKAGEEYYTTNLRTSKFIAKGTEPATVGGTNKYYKLTAKGNQLEWNTALWSTDENDFMSTGTGGTGTGTDGTGTANDEKRRLLGGNVYGGCYNSGHVNGNVVININQDLIKRDVVFAQTDGEDEYTISGDRRSGVLREAQGDDTQSVAMTVFGAGYGEETEIWGSTTVNLNNGYTFQIFGGGEEGVVGKKNNAGDYVYDARYSSTVNMKGPNAGYSEKVSGLPLAETEYIYGGGNEGDVIGDAYVYLGNGRVYDAFGGASNADIYGGTEVYIGHNGGFPWVRDNVYGGNDFGGTIRGKINHTTDVTRTAFDPEMLKSATFVKYIQGRTDSIFGGNYGSYDYADPVFKDYTYSRGEESLPTGKVAGNPRLDGEGNPVFTFPHMVENSFVYFKPVDNSNNSVGYVFGGSEGFPGNVTLNDAMQEECYVLMDDTQSKNANRFANMDIYGGGAFAGTGTAESKGAGRTAVDLYAGSFHNVYGGCNQEGLVGYTRVNVPSGSTVKVNALFGGGKGYDPALFKVEKTKALAARYCDHYVTCVDYQSGDAIVNDGIYGGNENSRIACDTYINITAPVMQSSGYQATIYGAGYGRKTLTGRTNVFMNNGSNAYKVFGGGRDGNAFNFASMRQWLKKQFIAAGSTNSIAETQVTAYGGILTSFGTYLASNPITLPDKTGTYVNESTGEYDGTYTNDILPTLEKPMPGYHQTNVHIMKGGNVSGYAYGGGYGKNAVVSGSTYIELKGGNVDKDVYGSGQGGIVMDEFELKSFTATTNVNIESGMCRNVYGGGYQGHTGKHCTVDPVDLEITEDDINTSYAGDVPAVTNVVIGKVDGTGFYDGIPAIQRNAYGGGEGGSVYGTTNLTINNGYIGYRYKNTATSGAPVYKYVEELDDQKPNSIEKAGNAFGGGYVVNSYVDKANVTMYGGTIRGSLYGGGELGPIGAGTTSSSFSTTTGIESGNVRIFRPGKTQVKMYDGHVKRNVFGGGRGQDSWGGDGTLYMDEKVVASLRANGLFCKGYVFGQTEVDIYGGEVGTDEGVAQGYGNVFGGGDIGYVYSAYETEDVHYTQEEIDAAEVGDAAYGKTTSDIKTPGGLCVGKKPAGSVRYDGNEEGYYYKYENGAFVTSGSEKVLTEDCKVLVEPWCKALSAININSTDYAAGAFVPTSALNYLGNKADPNWITLSKADVNKEGVIIHNAVFAGGNTSPGSTDVYANTTTVYGNATASVHDVYNRDLISIGRGRVGGLYGDGNLTLVDGYRETNITNYGTDYYHINSEITLAEYNALPNREAAYYEIRYKCLQACTDKDGKNYAVGSTITADEMQTVFEGVTVGEPAQAMIQPNGKPLEAYWKENGVCSRYAGRPMNTVQRSDFCGVFGSRMVMMGAQDRVPETVDYTNYTINRVREVSLNKKTSVRAADASDNKNKEHGNYFGIYSVVNYLGALTSDVDFHTAKRVTDNSDTETYQANAKGKSYGTATYYDWKDEFHEDRRRNNGTSHNKVALASGVYLELTTEKSTGTGLTEKDWGYITGVVELDLINVQPGMGGGYVYAKNEHGTRQDTHKDQTILTALNTGAATNKKFSYVNTTVSDQKEWETSGNFVHSTQTIIDDCYNIGGKYKVGESPVPAHYWFIKGAIYVYDQYISAYTGNPNAFSETVSIPLTITSASHGKMTLLNVMPNHYAYYSVNTNTTQTKLGENDKIELRDVQYGLNDAISYWDYSQLTAAEKKLFVPETYTVIADCTYGDGATPVTYKAGTVLLPSEYEALKDAAPTKKLEETDTDVTPYVHHVSRDQDVDIDYVFRPSNNVSHNTGYILTYNIDNPNQWNTWYTPKSGSASAKNQTGGDDYEDGPTYTPNTTGLYGQNDYHIGNIIDKDVYDTYQNVVTNHSSVIPSGQATFKPAYIVTADLLETTKGSGDDAVAQRLHKGATLAKEDYTPANWTAMSGSVDEAFVVTKTIQLSKTEFIYRGTYMSEAEKESLASTYTSLATEINKSVVPAYYCTSAGKYGGNYYETGKNYRALAAFTSMSESDRNKFTFNYDALDLLIDPNYSKDPTTGNVIHAEGQKYQYDGENFTTAEQAATNKATYSLATPIDYSATYKGDTPITYRADNGTDVSTNTRNELTRTEYERLPNEQYYWAPITVATGKTGDYYVVKETIVLGDTPYAAGQVISSDTYSGLGDTDKQKVAKLNFTTAGTYYYCREAYTIQNNDKGHAINSYTTGVTGGTGGTYSKSQTVPKGVIIDATAYGTLTNEQKNFSIHGLAPTETSSLFVTRGSDIFDLSAEKIITVIYQYDYVESDMTGTHITPVSERHILNIHLNFKSGVPTVEDIQTPDIILPGTMLSIPEPYVTPGAYEITGGGWKLFDTESDAESHINGVEYTPLSDPLYLYQNKHYLAYYAKTYLGETFSNHVPVHVANYHDLKKVMNDTIHHYYIDHKEIYDRLKVEPKIYINDYTTDDPETSQNGLDLFKNLYDLSLVTTSSTAETDGYTVTNGKITAATGTANTALVDQYLLDKTRVGAAKNLEFILRTDINHPDSWTPIGTDDVCFKGTLHGDGHTISGLDHSLFRNLCGDVYNLGVRGSFNTAGVADLDTEAGVTKKGYVESCWVKTTSTTPLETKLYPVLGSPTDNKGYQLVNSYFLNDNSTLFNTVPANGLITYTNGSKGTARAMTEKEFYNGTVAYDLNNFYLHKRYSDKQVNSGQAYKYWKAGETEPQTGYYDNRADLCSSGYTYTESEVTHMLKYVEDRFEDGDFRFAGGVIPDDEDERWWEEELTDEHGNKYMVDHWSPIWPDDYLFFGQKLTYGYSATQAHQEVPTAVVKTDGHLSQNDDANRVYRAPAYFRSKDMSFIHFNPQAYLAQKSSDGTKEVYPGLTAIDFAGHYDTHTPEGPKAYELGMNDGKFYAPLLDDGGLTGITNYDETRNLLVYAPSETSDDGYANKATYDVLTGYFTDPAYSDYYSNPTTYRNVADATSVTSSIYGHLVMDKKIAKTDHLLVDKEDFNCPIAYTFDGSHRMWYQRTPEDQEYVDLTKGWQGISIPFTAELVTTNDKGEITHFYSGSATSANSDKKIGHEYWLREFDAINKVPDSDPEQAKASFLYPTATGSGKTVTNHFLWDYYYEKSGRKDKNSDIYQEYYRNDRPYASYPLLTSGTPYILGLPGKTYYEFDLSGNFTAQNTYAAIDKLGKQTITFASNTGAGIGVSDDETAGVEKSLTGTSKTFNFTFKPSYMNMSLAAGTYSYTLDADGDSYDKVPASGDATKVSAFRPYFIASSTPASSRKMAPERILFGGDFEGLEGEPISTLDGDLEIYVKDHKVVTTSHLKEATTVRIISVSGVTMANYVLQPGETVETPIRVEGAYIVNKKKLLVK